LRWLQKEKHRSPACPDCTAPLPVFILPPSFFILSFPPSTGGDKNKTRGLAINNESLLTGGRAGTS
jgi:hypothetical protein